MPHQRRGQEFRLSGSKSLAGESIVEIRVKQWEGWRVGSPSNLTSLSTDSYPKLKQRSNPLIILTIKGEQDQLQIEILVRQWQAGQIE